MACVIVCCQGSKVSCTQPGNRRWCALHYLSLLAYDGCDFLPCKSVWWRYSCTLLKLQCGKYWEEVIGQNGKAPIQQSYWVYVCTLFWLSISRNLSRGFKQTVSQRLVLIGTELKQRCCPRTQGRICQDTSKR